MVHSNDTHRALCDLLSRDPDGGEREPTEADYAAFERYALDTYGVEVWRTYMGSNWAEPADAI